MRKNYHATAVRQKRVLQYVRIALFCEDLTMDDPARRSRKQIEAEKGRRAVRGMVVRGINRKTLFPIPLTIIALTLDFSQKTVDCESFRE
jgi:hypothetical protein